MLVTSLLQAPQLGEYVWHEQSADATVDDVSRHHAERMKALIAEIEGPRPVRLLELGAYRHYAGHRVADELGADVWLSDISARALELGRTAAIARGCRRPGQVCAADFHDLPFADAAFDVVFIASAVHHSTRPELVLQEIARVTRPGGLIWLENEPVGRTACLYLYNVNRSDSHTPYERALADAGLLRWLSSPFHGTRPEELFGMVENDRIPLDLFLECFGRAGEPVFLQLDTGNTRQALETELEALCAGEGALARVSAALHERVAQAGEPDEVAGAIGVRAPTSAELWSLARRYVDACTCEPGEPGAERDRARARLYGAALQAKIRRAGAGTTSDHVFRRAVTACGEGWLDRDGPGGAAFMGWEKSLPDVFDASIRDEVHERYAPLGWTTVVEQSGAVSLANLSGSVRFPLPTARTSILLLRAYTVPTAAGPYRVVLRQGSRQLGECVVAQAESRLWRGLVHAGGGDVCIDHYDLEGRPLDIDWNLRVSVVQMLVVDA